MCRATHEGGRRCRGQMGAARNAQERVKYHRREAASRSQAVTEMATAGVGTYGLDVDTVHEVLVGAPAPKGMTTTQLKKAIGQVELTAAEARDARRHLFATLAERMEQPASPKAVAAVVEGHDIPSREREQARLAVLAHQKLTGRQVVSMLHDPSPRVRNAAKRRVAKGTRNRRVES